MRTSCESAFFTSLARGRGRRAAPGEGVGNPAAKRMLVTATLGTAPSISMSVLAVATNVIAEYPGVRALDNVSVTIETGSITALVGPNGAGKTTLMRCLCGLERPVAGQVRIGEVDVIEAPRQAHRYIGFLPDFLGLYDDLTVAQCLTYAARANGVEDGVAARVAQVAAELDLTTRLHQRTGELSRGLRQRVAIAQTTVHAPRLLILDEPAAGLDPEARHALSVLFKRLKANGMTLLVSSHILAELADYATHMLVLREGRAVEQKPLTVSATRTTLELAVMEEPARLAAWLAAYPEVAQVEARAATVVCDFSAAAQDRANLLAALLEGGFRVTHFAVTEPDLQQSYLATLRQPSPDES